MNTIPACNTRVRVRTVDITGTVYQVRYDSRGEALIDINVDPDCQVPNDYFVARIEELDDLGCLAVSAPPTTRYVFVLYYRRTRLSNWMVMSTADNAPRHAMLMGRLIVDIEFSNLNPRGLIGQHVFSMPADGLWPSMDVLDNKRPNNPNIQTVTL